ncbi:carbohydrate kinase family protein [Candidatus Bathyarchaeota archaeon]|nr:carbohydrate kinase family protein [Candidatus Bathyarchaeota archaeon]
MTEFDAIGFGALNMDKLFRVNRIAGAEEESFITGFEETCGGSAANTMVGLARLGCRVGFIGKLGDDREGRLLLEDFHRENVDTAGIRTVKQGRSGIVMGFVGEKGERALYIDAGANDEVTLNKADLAYASKTKFLHLTSFVGAESFESQKRLVEELHSSVNVGLDPGMLYARRGLAALNSIIERTFVLMPNVGELELLTGMTNYRAGAKTLLDRGVEIVAVKLGAKGCYVTDGKEDFLTEAFKVKVVDTTGAGDAFNAGFLYGLIHSKSLMDCAKLGNFVASRCVMKMGARTGLPGIIHLQKAGLC